MNGVEIVQNKNEGLGKRSQIIDQVVDNIFELIWLDTLRHLEQVVRNGWGYWHKGGKQVLQETDRVIITLIQREPGRSKVCLSEPVADQGGFSVTGWSGNQDERSV